LRRAKPLKLRNKSPSSPYGLGVARETLAISVCCGWRAGADDDEHYVYTIAL